MLAHEADPKIVQQKGVNAEHLGIWSGRVTDRTGIYGLASPGFTYVSDKVMSGIQEAALRGFGPTYQLIEAEPESQTQSKTRLTPRSIEDHVVYVDETVVHLGFEYEHTGGGRVRPGDVGARLEAGVEGVRIPAEKPLGDFWVLDRTILVSKRALDVLLELCPNDLDFKPVVAVPDKKTGELYQGAMEYYSIRPRLCVRPYLGEIVPKENIPHHLGFCMGIGGRLFISRPGGGSNVAYDIAGLDQAGIWTEQMDTLDRKPLYTKRSLFDQLKDRGFTGLYKRDECPILQVEQPQK